MTPEQIDLILDYYQYKTDVKGDGIGSYPTEIIENIKKVDELNKKKNEKI